MCTLDLTCTNTSNSVPFKDEHELYLKVQFVLGSKHSLYLLLLSLMLGREVT